MTAGGNRPADRSDAGRGAAAPGINFDRVAAIYDETRALPPGVPERIADAVIAAVGAGPTTRFLEPGIGTGRIALPFIRRGFPYTGVDISSEMTDRLRERAGAAPNLTLLSGSVTALPVPDSSVDVVLVAHLLHLVPEWRTALREIDRVLAPGGVVVQVDDRRLAGGPADEIRAQWRALVGAAGGGLRPEYGSPQALERDFTARGWRLAVYRPAIWEYTVSPSALLARLLDRTYSDSWDVSDEALQVADRGLRTWVVERFGDLDTALPDRVEALVTVAWPPMPGEEVVPIWPPLD